MTAASVTERPRLSAPEYLSFHGLALFLSPGRNRREFSEHPAELGGCFAGQTETISDSYRNRVAAFTPNGFKFAPFKINRSTHIPDTAGKGEGNISSVAESAG